jgi:hypothetical protein
MPQMAKECGEDIIPDCVTAAMKASSMTSCEVINKSDQLKHKYPDDNIIYKVNVFKLIK